MKDWLLRADPSRPALIYRSQVISYGELRAQVAQASPPFGRLWKVAGDDPLNVAITLNAAILADKVLYVGENLEEELPTSLPAAAFLLVKTSGSTAKPKYVVLTQENIRASVAASRQRLGLNADDCWLLCLPLFHVGGISILYRVLEAGASALLQGRFEAQAVLNQLYANKITHISLVPAMLSQLLDMAPASPPPNLRCVLTGGAALASGLMQKGQAKGWPIIPTYGMSETASQIATLYPVPENWQAGMVGKPLDGISIRLDKEGRIGVKGPMVMAGYLEGPQPFDSEGYLLSNDQGEILSDGGLLVKGRLDDVLISGGKNISPLAVEEVLSLCPEIGQVYITARNDPVWGDLLIAIYDGKANPEAVLEFAKARLPSFQRPREVKRVDAFPLGGSGKIDRKKLRALAF